MTPKEFAKAIVTSGDLDPDYLLMNNLRKAEVIDAENLGKWVGLKSVIYNSEQELCFLIGIKTDLLSLKRGAERSKNSDVETLRSWEALESFSGRFGGWLRFWRGFPIEANAKLKALQDIHGVGPWAAWKIMDLTDRVLGVQSDLRQIDFRAAYQFPLKGMLICAGIPEADLPRLLKDDTLYQKVLKAAILALGDAASLLAPPLYERKLNLQEFETIFCKYHSFVHKKYRVNQDLEKLRERFKKSEHLAHLREFCP